MEIPEKFLTIGEVADILRVTPRTIYRYIEEEKITAKKMGYVWRFKKEEVIKFIDRQPTNKEL